MLQCLTDIVGVTDSTAPCIIDGLTSDQITNLKKICFRFIPGRLAGRGSHESIKTRRRNKKFLYHGYG
jgi:hypothetical protein